MTIPTTEQISQKNNENKKTQSTTKLSIKHRRRRRKHKRKQKQPISPNILEVTTGRGLLTNQSFDFTQNEIVQSLNENPEQKIRLLRKKKKKIKSKLHHNNSSSVHLFIHGGENNSVLPTANGNYLKIVRTFT